MSLDLTQERFGEYSILGELGSGGQGVVLKARRENRIVALKLVHRADPKIIARFKQEGRVLQQLRHPNLPRVFEAGQQGGLPFLALEFVDGEDLRSIVESRGVPPFDWTARVLQSVAHALHACHAAGVVHRDVKPANVIIERGSGRPVLVDFGMLKADLEQVPLGSLEDAVARLSSTGELHGTPAYMAPEQIQPGKYGPVSARTDVYALGCMLFFLLTGKRPFQGDINLATLVVQILTAAPADPRTHDPQIPAPLAQFCLRCLEKDPRQRPASGLQFAEALASAAGVVRLPSLSSTGGDGPASEIAGFQVLGELGRGGFGVVYLVQPPEGGTPLALKMLLQQSPKRKARFEREARVLETLGRHSGIVAIKQTGEANGVPYLVMERIEGGTLSDLLRRADRETCLDVLVQTARALHFAHEAGVVHRDLKPDNILIRADGSAALTDFGLARDSADDQRLTRTGEFLGTAPYMALEQLKGAPVDRRTDVYALGVILYQVLAKGALPFSGALIQIVAQAMACDPVRPRSIDPTVTPALESLCLRALSPDAEDRPQTAEDFARLLEEARRGGGASGGGGSLARAAAALLFLALGGTLAVAITGLPSTTGSPTAGAGSSGDAPPPDSGSDAGADLPPTASSAGLLEPPPWFEDLDPSRRPALPLPPGLAFTPQAGEYLNQRDGSVLVWVWPGTFLMGSNESPAARPPHEVLITRGFFLGKHEVTRKQFLAYCHETGQPAPQGVTSLVYLQTREVPPDDAPVHGASPQEIDAYCAWASARLPTEAEWEYAARGAQSLRFPWGNEPGEQTGNLGRGFDRRTPPGDQRDPSDGYGLLAPVGSFPAGASPFGALDMIGNLTELVADRYGPHTQGPQVDPLSMQGRNRIGKGKSWKASLLVSFAANRTPRSPTRGHSTLGFRIARSHPADPGRLYPVDLILRAEAFVREHPENQRAARLLESLRQQFTGLAAQPANTPPWYRDLSESARPTLPLPQGLLFGRGQGEYVVERDGSVLVWVPPGSFRMGDDGQSRCRPSHDVLVSRGFFVGKYEVSWAQLEAYSRATRAKLPSPVFKRLGQVHRTQPDEPAHTLSQAEARAYCDWAGLRLPSEAEWELAARGPTSRRYPWGESYEPTRANVGLFRDGASQKAVWRDTRDGYPFLAPVRAFAAGAAPCGALNMAGNVAEWVADRHQPYSSAPRLDPRARGHEFVFRGMSWGNHPDTTTGAFRKWSATFKGSTIGFRVALSHPGSPGASYPQDPLERARAYVRDHPHDARARGVLESLEYEARREALPDRPATPEPKPGLPPPVPDAPIPQPGEAPAWYSQRPPVERPALPLPEGVGFGQAPGEYLNASDGSVLVWVPSGSFRMGDDGFTITAPVHDVLVSRGFFLGKYELTRANYRDFCEATGRTSPAATLKHLGETWTAPDDAPVADVSWNDAAAYCAWAGLRLPSEAEWELAARGPGGRTFPWGEEFSFERANVGRSLEGGPKQNDNRDARDGNLWPAPVGSYPNGAAPCGALDMIGNINEWVGDTPRTYDGRPQVDPHALTGTRRLFKGMSWGTHPQHAIAAYRKIGSARSSARTVGFRVARSHPGDPGARYPKDPVERAAAYVKDHPHDQRAFAIWDALRGR